MIAEKKRKSDLKVMKYAIRKHLQVPELTRGGPALREFLEELSGNIPAGSVSWVPSTGVLIVLSAYALV